MWRWCVGNKDCPKETPEKCQASLQIEDPLPAGKLDDQTTENIVMAFMGFPIHRYQCPSFKNKLDGFITQGLIF